MKRSQSNTLVNSPKQRIQTTNLLKTNDDNFKYLLNIIMGIQLSVQSTSNINLIGEHSIDQFYKSLKYTLASTHFNAKTNEVNITINIILNLFRCFIYPTMQE